MDNLDSFRRLAIFASVVDEGGFSAAARKLGITKTAVSKQVRLLEESWGVQLLHRTTRRVRPTLEGEAVLEHARRVHVAGRAARDAVAGLRDAPAGSVRITAPTGLGQRLVAPVLADYSGLYPRVEVELRLDDRPVDIVKEGIDLAIRGGRMPDSSLRRRKLGALELLVVGAPGYLERRGVPRSADALQEHDWVVYTPLGRPQRFELGGPEGSVEVRVDGRLATDDGDVVRTWLLRGLGLSLLPRFWVEADLAAGRLQPVLPRSRVKAGAVYAVHAFEGRVPARVRALIDLLRRAAPIRGL